MRDAGTWKLVAMNEKTSGSPFVDKCSTGKIATTKYPSGSAQVGTTYNTSKFSLINISAPGSGTPPDYMTVGYTCNGITVPDLALARASAHVADRADSNDYPISIAL